MPVLALKRACRNDPLVRTDRRAGIAATSARWLAVRSAAPADPQGGVLSTGQLTAGPERSEIVDSR